MKLPITFFVKFIKIFGCSLLLLISRGGQTIIHAQQRQRPPVRAQDKKDLQQDYFNVLKEYQKYEDKIRREREDYYQRTRKRFIDLQWQIVDLLRDMAHGKSPNRMPDPKDIYDLVNDYGRYVGETLNPIVDLSTEGTEIGLRLQKLNQRSAELRHADLSAVRRSPPVPAHPPTSTSKKPVNFDELDDAIDLWGYKELGDRYFDGRPQVLMHFLDKHPEYKLGVRPEFPPDFTKAGQPDSASGGDGEMYEDNDAADMFGYMSEGERYFQNRPEDFKRFKERYPYYKELTWDALAASERAETERRAMEAFNNWKKNKIAEYYSNCAEAEANYKNDMKIERGFYASLDADCDDPILSLADRSKCHQLAHSGLNSMVKSLTDYLEKERSRNYCGRDDDLLRFLDLRKPQL